MNYPLTASFEIKNQQERELFEHIMTQIKNINKDKENVVTMIESVSLRPSNLEKQARVRIHNNVIAVGTRTNMLSRYQQEVGMSPNTRIVLEEMVDSEWKIVRGTRRQAV